mgnify:CR=1 FL=1
MAFRACFGMRVGADALIGPLFRFAPHQSRRRRGDHRSPAFCAPILFFLFWRKKRIAAPGEEKKENLQNRKCIPYRHHVTAHLPSHICPPQITFPLATTRRTLS